MKPYLFHNLAGGSKAMRETYRLLELAAQSDATVLLTGESGTGKGMAAQAIHALSRRHGQPFVEVTAAALPETLLESELFGHVKGAFTGAVRDRPGRFELAQGGTLFLDEVGEIPLAVQAKLLRVLQSRTFERVGDTQTQTADIRLIAATHRDLRQQIQAGKFREDLYFRIKVFPIHMPALRERLEDLPELAEHFLAQFRKKTGKPIRKIDTSAWKILRDYCWPGNVRELENAIEFAFVTCQGDTIMAADLPHDIRHFEQRFSTCSQRRRQGEAASELDANAILANPANLQKLLAECQGNKAEAARRLGISRTLVWKWLKRHGGVGLGN